MNKVVLIPDSFKGTMSSGEICAILKEEVHRHYPEAEVVSIPVADGGEGSVDAFLSAMGGERVDVRVKGPFGGDTESFYGLVDQGSTAVIEMAACAGLPLVGEHLRPDQTTTYGVGQLIAHALDRGCRKLVVGLGGSATNDMGTGAAAALGVRFLDEQGNSFVPVGGTLSRIRRIDRSSLHPRLEQVEKVAMCDIDNPLYGPNGAAHVFGPQKGADPAMVERLDRELRMAAGIVERDLGVEISQIPGAGAAGGMGGGMAAFLGAQLQMGIEAVLDLVSFEQIIRDADFIFTGEGKFDSQSLRGKVVIGVARRAKPLHIPVIALVGDIGDGVEPAYREGVSAIFSINRVAVDFPQAKSRAHTDLALTMDNLLRFLKGLGR